MSDKKRLKELKAAREAWEAEHQNDFQRERKKQFATKCGIPVDKLYMPLDLQKHKFDYMNDLGLPGEFPFTRSLTPSGYREHPYIIQQQTGHSTPEETNKLISQMLAAGMDEIDYSIDAPSKLGYDSDNPLVRGEVGRCGFAWDSAEDIDILLDGIDMTKTGITWTCAALSIIPLAAHLAVAEKRGYRREDLMFRMQNDVLNAMVVMDENVFPLNHAMRMAIDTIEYVTRYMPKSIPLSLLAHHARQAGAGVIQEVGQIVSSAVAYVRAASKRGIDVDVIAPKMYIVAWMCHRDFFEEIAGIRAMRRLWAKTMKELGAKNPDSWKVNISGLNPGLELAPGHPEVNILRIGLGILAASLAGVYRVGGATFDETMGIPSGEAIAAKIRSCYFIADETGAMDTIDPLGGSYYIEHLTSEIEQEARDYMKKIENMGGFMEAIKSGILQRDMAAGASRRQRQIDCGEMTVIGINKFPSDRMVAGKGGDKPNERAVEIQSAKLKRLRETRDNEKVRSCLDQVRAVAAKEGGSRDSNVVFPLVEAAKAYATKGEMTAALKDVWGQYESPGVF